MNEGPLKWIDTQRSCMVELLQSWVNINSESYHIEGLERMEGVLRAELAKLPGDVKVIDVSPQQSIDSAGNVVSRPLGRTLSVRIRPDAKIRVLLNIHYDTVYPAGH